MVSTQQLFKSLLYLFFLCLITSNVAFSQEDVNLESDQDSVTIENDSLSIARADSLNAFKERFTIYGKAAYGNGVLVPDAEVTLMDTLEKKLETTRTTTKLFRRFFGGRFEFENILPGEYIISVDLGTRVGIKKRIHLKNKNLDLGVVKNEVEFPKYEIGDYTDSTRIYFKRMATDPVEPDSINIRHIVVGLDGSANTVQIDSILRDSVFYTLSGELTRDSIPMDDMYVIYNDYGYMIHQSRSFRDRINEVQKRDGYVVFHSGDTLNFDNIFFEPSLKTPDVATFHYDDTTGLPRFHSFYDIYKVYTGPSYIERSVERGFYSALLFHGTSIAFQAWRKKSGQPALNYLPNFGNPEKKPNSYYSMITSFSVFTLGWVGYDWYMDRRSNYFTPKDEVTPFPKNMFVFSSKEWAINQAQPFVEPVYETRIWKWWKKREERKKERKRSKRKSVFD